MSIARLPETVFPLTQVNKVNEIVDVLNDNLNMYYSTQNPVLTSVDGVATWTVTHNLGTENVNCSLYNGDNLVISNVSITSDNTVTINFNSSVNIPADTYKIVIISNGAGSSSGSGSYVLPTASTTTLGGVRIDGSSITINNGVISSTNGQWVAHNTRLISGYINYPTTEVYTIDLTNELPKDNYTYEVMLCPATRSGTNVGDWVRVIFQSSGLYSDVFAADARCVVSGQFSMGSGQVNMPIGASRLLYIMPSASLTGTFSLWMSGYRKW